MTNSKKCIIKLGVIDITIFVLISLNIKVKVNIVLSTKVNPHIWIVSPKSEPLQMFEMMVSIKNREDLQKLNQSVSLQNQVKVVRLQDKLGRQNFHEDMKEVFEPVTKSLAKIFEKLTKKLLQNLLVKQRSNFRFE